MNEILTQVQLEELSDALNTASLSDVLEVLADACKTRSEQADMYGDVESYRKWRVAGVRVRTIAEQVEV